MFAFYFKTLAKAHEKIRKSRRLIRIRTVCTCFDPRPPQTHRSQARFFNHPAVFRWTHFRTKRTIIINNTSWQVLFIANLSSEWNRLSDRTWINSRNTITVSGIYVQYFAALGFLTGCTLIFHTGIFPSCRKRWKIQDAYLKRFAVAFNDNITKRVSSYHYDHNIMCPPVSTINTESDKKTHRTKNNAFYGVAAELVCIKINLISRYCCRTLLITNIIIANYILSNITHWY